MAPKPLYVASAMVTNGITLGEFLSAKAIEQVYHLYNKIGLGTSSFPLLNTPIGNQVHYHIRDWKYDMTACDWE